MENEKKGILLESGTNELELVEFGIGEQKFAINVIKVREVLNYRTPTHLPESHPSVEGLLSLRGEVMPVINLGHYLEFAASEQPDKDKIIVAEFNQTKVAFRVHSVFRIHRISWNQMEKPPSVGDNLEGVTTGVVKMDDRLILLLDFEKVMYDVNPDMIGAVAANEREEDKQRRQVRKVFVAEDSRTLREILEAYLPEVGYRNLTFFENGVKAWQALEQLVETHGEEYSQHVDLLITDIEMPQMDGHHLTRRIKEHSTLKSLPVVIFSSLITEELRHKGDSVGADAQVSKPQFTELAGVLDQCIQSME